MTVEYVLCAGESVMCVGEAMTVIYVGECVCVCVCASRVCFLCW